MNEDSRRKPERGPSRRLRFEDTPATSGQVGPKSKPGAKGRRRLAEAPADPKTPPPILDAPDASPPVEDTPGTSGQVGPKSGHGPAPPDKAKRRLRFEEDTPPGTSPPMEEAPATSGQVGPKSGGGKLKQDSEKARPSNRLRHEDEAPPVGETAEDGGAAPHDGPGPADKKAARDNKRFEKSGRRVEKSGDKLDKARDKLAKQKPPKKPGPVKIVGRAAGYQAWKYVHGKIHEVERENVGVEAAHKTELAGEKVVRRTTRLIKKRIRTRPARRVRKWEKKNIKARADYTFRQLAQEHPELNKNALSRFFQKQRIKKQYQKQAREAAKATKKAAEKTAVTVEKIAGAVLNFVKRNPKVFIIALCLFLIIVLLQSCLRKCPWIAAQAPFLTRHPHRSRPRSLRPNPRRSRSRKKAAMWE